jgi:hypothetical protein
MDAQRSANAEPYVVRQASAHDVDAVARIWHVGWADGHVGRYEIDFTDQVPGDRAAGQ